MNKQKSEDLTQPIQLTPRTKLRALAGSLGLFAGTGAVWAIITAIAPSFYASNASPIAYFLTVGAVLALFGALVTGQIRAFRVWFSSLPEVDGVDKKKVRTIARIAAVCVAIGMASALAIFIFNQFVWLPEVREIINNK